MAKKPSQKPRKNKTKAELVAEAEHKQKIDRQKTLARMIFPFIQDQATIYDAQTVVAALAGFIKLGIEQKSSKLVVSDLEIDVSKEEDSPIKAAIVNLVGLLQSENAEDAAALLERFGTGLAQFSSREYMKNPMNIIKADDFIAS